MKCHTCGRQTQNESANFCDYCGASFREQAQATPVSGMGQPLFSRPYTAESVPNTSTGTQQAAAEQPTSLLGWLWMYIILLIPLANIAMLLIWVFSDTTPVSKKNWAKATLIFLVFVFILFIGYMVTIMSSPMYQKMLQDYGPYLQ